MMKINVGMVFVGVVGVVVGWFGRGIWIPEEAADGSDVAAHDTNPTTRLSQSLGRSLSAQPSAVADPWESFQVPTTEADHQKVNRRVRQALETNRGLPGRMVAFAELVGKMTPENAEAMRAAFDESWGAGFYLTWERALLYSRYGEVMGAVAAESSQGHPEFWRVVNHWAQGDPDKAIDWVNAMEDGRNHERAVDAVIYGASLKSPDYGFRIFEQLDQDERTPAFTALTGAYRRSGAADGLAELADRIIRNSDDEISVFGKQALQQAYNVRRESGEESLNAWLKGLPTEHISLLDPNQLPEGFLEVAE